MTEYKKNDIIKALFAFHKMRNEEENILNNYINRLINELSSFSLDSKENKKKSKSLLTFISGNKYFIKNIFKKIIIIFRFTQLLPSFFLQKRKLNAIKSNQYTSNSIIIAISSNRLYSANGILAPKKYFASLTKSFSQQTQSDHILREIDSAENIYAFDPCLVSTLWKNKKKCWEEGVFIIDTSFLFFTFLISIFKILPRLIKNNIKNYAMFNFSNIKMIIFSFFFIEISEPIICKLKYFKAFFFTNNSFTTEVLRTYLMQHSKCTTLCEILHGMPSVTQETYFSTLLSFKNDKIFNAKHYFVAQIPNLPLQKIFKPPSQKTETAINLYLNKYLIEHKYGDPSFLSHIENECNFISSKMCSSDNTLIISIMGTTSNDQNYLNSNSFRIECEIMTHIKKTVEKLKKPFLIIYTPHPVHQISKFHKCSIFSEKNIILYKDTIFTWFIADISVALNSSALFEAAHFGVHAYTPLITEDTYYPKISLDLLNHSTENKKINFLDALAQFIISHAENSFVNIFTKAKIRLNRL